MVTDTQEPLKLYILVREDLPFGLQAAQAVHAVCKFARDYPLRYADWFNTSNYIVLLSVRNEDQLLSWADKFWYNKIEYSIFVEPDLDEHPNGKFTACAVMPMGNHRKILARLPLMGKKGVSHE